MTLHETHDDSNTRFDIEVVGLHNGVKREDVVIKLEQFFGVKQDKANKLLDSMYEEGSVIVKECANKTELLEFKNKLESCGMIVSANRLLALVDEKTAAKDEFTCPSCGHTQGKKDTEHGYEQCDQCGVFPHKYAGTERFPLCQDSCPMA